MPNKSIAEGMISFTQLSHTHTQVLFHRETLAIFVLCLWRFLMTMLCFNTCQFFCVCVCVCLCVCARMRVRVCVAYQHLNENLAKLTAKFEKATADKLKCQQEAESTARTISLANRLVRRATAGSRRASATQTHTHTHTHTHTLTQTLCLSHLSHPTTSLTWLQMCSSLYIIYTQTIFVPAR